LPDKIKETVMPIDEPFTAGFVVIRAGTHDVHDVRERLLKVTGVRVAHALIGPDDLICYLETYYPREFRIALDEGVRKLVDEGLIEHTETMMILADEGEGYSGEENRPAPAAAWLFCDISVGDPGPAAEKLKAIKGVVNAHSVIGRYDIIAYVEAPSMDELMRILDEDIRHVTEIRTTDTRLVLMKVTRAMPARNRDKQNPIGTKRPAASDSTKSKKKSAR
jgi:DNA-binding Lrp family transcriptional regulator